ncbi:zinc transporter ZntB [Maritalea sp.]|uniref:zinc transporter ZntB n=1 Tax=Maritalea sp. TaxID=2003361 RepID=UPI003EF48630
MTHIDTSENNDQIGLQRFSLTLDGHGHAHHDQTASSPHQLDPPKKGSFHWVHFLRDSAETRADLLSIVKDSVVVDALTALETRPRCTVHSNGALLMLRGINIEHGARPEDMVSIRLWITSDEVISVGQKPLRALNDLVATISRDQAPRSPGDLVAKLALRLVDEVEPLVADINSQVDDLEEVVIDAEAGASRGQLAEIRRMSILLRRYMLPQRDALTTLLIEDLAWLKERDRGRLREAGERVNRLGEDLDAIRDRAQIVHDQLMDKRAETMNKQMFVLSIVAALFLPLGLLTGLLGINVGGMPGVDSPWAFSVVCFLMVVIGGFQFWWFKKIGMF